MKTRGKSSPAVGAATVELRAICRLQLKIVDFAARVYAARDVLQMPPGAPGSHEALAILGGGIPFWVPCQGAGDSKFPHPAQELFADSFSLKAPLLFLEKTGVVRMNNGIVGETGHWRETWISKTSPRTSPKNGSWGWP